MCIRDRDQAAARAAQGLVRGGGDDVRMGDRARMQAGRDQARDMRHVHNQVCARAFGDFAHARKVDNAGIGGRAGDDDRCV